MKLLTFMITKLITAWVVKRVLHKITAPIDDDVSKINEKLIQADGIIFSTPVYMENLSGILKTFIDRNYKWCHRSDLLRKPCLCDATTNGSGLENTLN
jgi:multimeric flavodoxin WrbA